LEACRLCRAGRKRNPEWSSLRQEPEAPIDNATSRGLRRPPGQRRGLAIRGIHVLGEWRVIYVAKIRDAIYVLHAFQKKSQKTSQRDIELAHKRYKQIGE
jgi:hypothetical protein